MCGTTHGLQLLKMKSEHATAFTISFWVWKMESRTTVLTLLNVVTDAFTSILGGSLPFVLVNMKFVYKCECIIKCKMLI